MVTRCQQGRHSRHRRTRVFTSIADSGAVMRRSFCPTCGTPLFSEAEPRPHLIIVRAGSLDDPNIARAGRGHLGEVGAAMACFDPDLAARGRRPTAGALNAPRSPRRAAP